MSYSSTPFARSRVANVRLKSCQIIPLGTGSPNAISARVHASATYRIKHRTQTEIEMFDSQLEQLLRQGSLLASFAVV